MKPYLLILSLFIVTVANTQEKSVKETSKGVVKFVIKQKIDREKIPAILKDFAVDIADSLIYWNHYDNINSVQYQDENKLSFQELFSSSDFKITNTNKGTSFYYQKKNNKSYFLERPNNTLTLISTSKKTKQILGFMCQEVLVKDFNDRNGYGYITKQLPTTAGITTIEGISETVLEYSIENHYAVANEINYYSDDIIEGALLKLKELRIFFVPSINLKPAVTKKKIGDYITKKELKNLIGDTILLQNLLLITNKNNIEESKNEDGSTIEDMSLSPKYLIKELSAISIKCKQIRVGSFFDDTEEVLNFTQKELLEFSNIFTYGNSLKIIESVFGISSSPALIILSKDLKIIFLKDFLLTSSDLEQADKKIAEICSQQ